MPYDWWYGVEDLVLDSVQIEGTTTMLVLEIESLASTSQNRKVTIITNSNGGLLAKALMIRLEQLGKNNLVDKIILVASPQFGTPKAIAGLLYGDDQSILMGAVLSKSTARTFGENTPGTYGLLPSSKYFATVASPVIEFSPEVRKIYNFKVLYSENIDNQTELFIR